MEQTSAQDGNKKRVLLVDDDPLLLRIYRDGLASRFEVEVAGDGLAALKALSASRPDMVVLDLMMPKFSGVDVLKFIRSQPRLTELPVIVVSNSYMNDLAEQATRIGVQKGLLKIRCTPQVLIGVINDLFAGRITEEDLSQLIAVPRRDEPPPPTPVPAATAPDAATKPVETSAARAAREKKSAEDFSNRSRREFLDNAAATSAAIQNLCQRFINARSDIERDLRLQDFYRKIHFASAAAGLAHCHQIALLASALEALLFELMSKLDFLTPSGLRTIARTTDFLGSLFDLASADATSDPSLRAQVLVVDDDPLSNRLITAALYRAQLQARSTENPLVALQWLNDNHYDLILLDIEMPGMTGFEVCKRLRALPGHNKTPVIYVTAHSDFESRAQSVLSGGDDLIAKPVFPMELAVKAVTHLLKSRLPEKKPD